MKFDINVLMTALQNNVNMESRDLGAVATKNDGEYISTRKEYMDLKKQFIEKIKNEPELMDLMNKVLDSRNKMEARNNIDHYLLGGREMLHLVLDAMIDDSMNK